MDAAQLLEIAAQFDVTGDPVSIGPFGSGHINDTYLLMCCKGGVEAEYVLQRINHTVFPDPALLMRNFLRVTSHIRLRLEPKYSKAEIDQRVLQATLSTDGEPLHLDEHGNHWRMSPRIADTSSVDVVQSDEQAFRASRAFGEFVYHLSDLPGPPLGEVIPRFHDGLNRLEILRRTAQRDPSGRTSACQTELQFAEEHRDLLALIPRLVDEGHVPLRTVHNDTKINNVLFDDDSGEAVCIVDLDTVMPGVSLYDFGELVRTTVSPSAEDETDLSRIKVQLPRYRSLVHGFLEGTGGILTKDERTSLAIAGAIMALTNGIRFLTDHIDGDNYFKVQRDGHNLDRCRAQFTLTAALLANQTELNKIASSLR